jgi:hypothetical protein
MKPVLAEMGLGVILNNPSLATHIARTLREKTEFWPGPGKGSRKGACKIGDIAALIAAAAYHSIGFSVAGAISEVTKNGREIERITECLRARKPVCISRKRGLITCSFELSPDCVRLMWPSESGESECP